MKTSELLRLARDNHLDSVHSMHKTIYVCIAIAKAAKNVATDKAFLAYRRVKRRIAKSMHPHQTVEEWLIERGHAKHNQIYRNCEQKQAMHDYRHRWITAMIAEYEAKGD